MEYLKIVIILDGELNYDGGFVRLGGESFVP